MEAGSSVPGPSGRDGSSMPVRPTRLEPPSTIISPPSPIDAKSEGPSVFDSPPAVEDSSGPLTVESPVSSPEASHQPLGSPAAEHARANKERTPRGHAAHDREPMSPAHLADRLRQQLGHQSPSSQSRSDSLLPPLPDSPEIPDIGSSPRTSTSPFPRSPSPSSPSFHNIRLSDRIRRRSSSHRVRETVAGEQKSAEDGARVINQYRIGRSLGKGAFAKVELAVDMTTGTEYAIKEFSKSRLQLHSLQEKHRMKTQERLRRLRTGGKTDQGPDEVEPKENGLLGEELSDKDPLGLIRREIAVMKKLDHPYLVKLFEAISVPNADALFLVLEYLPGGVLMSMKPGGEAPSNPPFSQDQTREYFRQLCLGLEYLHSNAIIHRDVKPENVLVSADRTVVKLCDFGVSEMFVGTGDDRIKKSGGSPAFLSPESFTSSSQEVHGRAVDIWALGVTLYCMLTGVLPFNTAQPLELYELVQKQSPRIPAEWSSDLKDMVSRMLEKDPDRRLSMDEIREHPWVTDNGKESMISTWDNLYSVGQQVEEPTKEELRKAISTKSVFTVVRAAQKFLATLRRSRQASQNTGSGGSGPGSTAVSLTSGSMDSYTSNPPGSHSDVTSPEASEGREWLTAKVLSPASFGPTPGSDDLVPSLDIGSRSDETDHDSRHVRQRKDTGAAGQGNNRPQRTEDRLGAAADKEGAGGPVAQARDRFKGLLGIDTGSQRPSPAGEAEPEREASSTIMDSPVDNETDGFQTVESPIEAHETTPDILDSPVSDKGDTADESLVDSPTNTAAAQWKTVDSPIEDHGGEPDLVASPVSEHGVDAAGAGLVESPAKVVEQPSLVDSPVEEQDNRDLSSGKK